MVNVDITRTSRSIREKANGLQIPYRLTTKRVTGAYR